MAGLIRGNPYATIGEQTYITRRRGKGEKAGKKSYRAILAYAEEVRCKARDTVLRRRSQTYSR